MSRTKEKLDDVASEIGEYIYIYMALLHSQFRASRNRSATDLLKPVVNKPISAWMRSLALYLSVLTDPQRPVNMSVTSCCDRAVAMLFSTGLSQVVVTELQQCCFQQACRKLLTQSCSNAVFNNLRQTCCKPRIAPYEAFCIHYFEQKTAKQVAIFRL